MSATDRSGNGGASPALARAVGSGPLLAVEPRDLDRPATGPAALAIVDEAQLLGGELVKKSSLHARYHWFETGSA